MITIDTLRAVASYRTLTVNAAGDEIESQSFQRFRSFFNIGTARTENRQTLDAIRTAIQNDPRFASLGETGVQTLDSLLGAIRTDRAISSRKIHSVIDQMEQLFNKPVYQRRGMELRIDAHLAANPRPAALRILTDTQYINIAHNTIANSANRDFASVNVPERLADLNSQLEHLFAEIGDDADLRAIILASPDKFFHPVSSTALYDTLLPTIQAFRANLTAAPHGDTPAEAATYRHLTTTLLRSIAEPIDPHLFTDLCNLAANLPLQTVAALGPNATPDALCRALNNHFAALAGSIQAQAGSIQPNSNDLNRLLSGGDTSAPTLIFIASMAAMRLPEADRANLYTLLTSPAATQVINLYNDSKNLAHAEYGILTKFMLDGVADCDNRTVPPPVIQDVDYTLFSPTILTRFRPLECIFSGNAAEPLRHLLRNIPGCIDNPQSTNLFKEECSGDDFLRAIVPTVKSYVAFNAANETVKAYTGETTMFEKDIGRNIAVRLPDGTMLPNNHTQALDKLAAILSGEPNAHFETASKELRNRIHLVTSFLSQNTEIIIDEGIPKAINGSSAGAAFALAVDQDSQRDFNLAINPDGGITLTYDRNVAVQAVNSLTTNFTAKPGSFLAAQLSVTLTGEDMDRFVAVDWKEVDLSAARDRNLHPHGPGDCGNLIYAIPASCRLAPQIEVGYNLHLDA